VGAMSQITVKKLLGVYKYKIKADKECKRLKQYNRGVLYMVEGEKVKL
jgi:hypothetical protein